MTNTMNHTSSEIERDARPAYRAAQAWVTTLLDGVGDDQYELPTPCDDWTVRRLCAHLVGTVERARGVGADGTFETTSADGPALDDDEWTTAFDDATARQWEAWSDDAVLERIVRVPWGEVTGNAALLGYVRELLIHGWDLAVATGQPSEADSAIAEAVLASAYDFLPAGVRGAAEIPFDEPVDPAAGAGPTERLANWFGHHR